MRVRTGPWRKPIAWKDSDYRGLDEGIRFAVRVLHASGFETCESCQGGPGHCYSEPTVDLHGGEDGFGAVATLTAYGLLVYRVSRVWYLDDVGLSNAAPIWRVELRKPHSERADELPMFSWGYQSQWRQARKLRRGGRR